MVEPIGDFQRDVCHVKELLLNVGAQISLVSKHHAIVILPFDILEILNVMDTGGSHVMAVDDSAYSADCVEFISIIAHILRGAATPCRCQLRSVASHGATLRSCVTADRDRFGVYAEHIFASVHCRGYVFADFFAKSVSEFAALIVLATGYKMRKSVATLILQAIKQVVFTIDVEDFRRGGKSEDFQIREPRDSASAGYIPQVIYTIPCEFFEYVKDFSELYDEVVHKRDVGNQWIGHH